jgi:integrase
MSDRRSKVPKYCLLRAKGLAYVWIKGKVRYLGKHNSPDSLEEYGRIIAELASNPVPITVVPSSAPLTVVEVADAYWQFAQGYYRDKAGNPSRWLDQIRLVLEKQLSALYGRTLAAEFGPKAFKAVRHKMIDAGQSRKYINQMMSIVKRCFKWAASEELVPASVYHSLQTVEGLRIGRTSAHETEPIKPVPDAVVDATLSCLPVVVADMVRFQRLTGARPGEVCQLRPGDIDRSNGREVWEYQPATHKTQYRGRERIIHIGPKAQAVIAPYLLRDPQSNCFQPVESEQKRHKEQRTRRKSKVQPSQQKRRRPKPKRPPKTAYDKNSYNRAIQRGVEKANKQRISGKVATRAYRRSWSVWGPFPNILTSLSVSRNKFFRMRFPRAIQ